MLNYSIKDRLNSDSAFLTFGPGQLQLLITQ